MSEKLPVLVNNNGAIFAESAMRLGFWELRKATSDYHFDYVATEIRLHPAQKPLLFEAATKGLAEGNKFAGMSVIVDPSMRDDEIHVRNADDMLLIRITNLGKIRESGENNA